MRPSIPIDDPKNILSHDTVRRTKWGIAHMVNYHDFTLHLAFAAQDGGQVVEKGWGAEASACWTSSELGSPTE